MNGKKYIGQTTNETNRRKILMSHVRGGYYPTNHFHNAIRKHGIESFIYGLIEECDDTELSDREVYWIGYYNTLVHGYNGTTGGERFQHTEETKRKMRYSQRRTKKHFSEAGRERIRQTHLGNVGTRKGTPQYDKMVATQAENKRLREWRLRMNETSWLVQLVKGAKSMF